jgi:hypothetical protein
MTCKHENIQVYEEATYSGELRDGVVYYNPKAPTHVENVEIICLDCEEDFTDCETTDETADTQTKLVEALAYVVNWHREHDSGEGELFGRDYVTACISALRSVDPEWRCSRLSTEEAAPC